MNTDFFAQLHLKTSSSTYPILKLDVKSRTSYSITKNYLSVDAAFSSDNVYNERHRSKQEHIFVFTSDLLK